MCFEVLFTSYIRDYLNQNKDSYPSFIVNLTNDSWLLDSAGPKHHLFLRGGGLWNLKSLL